MAPLMRRREPVFVFGREELRQQMASPFRRRSRHAFLLDPRQSSAWFETVSVKSAASPVFETEF
jgi:hypothetical protein